MNKKDIIIVLLICVVCVLGGILIGQNSSDSKKNNSDVTEKESNTKKDKNNKENTKEENKEDKEIKNEGISVLDKAIGEWGQCDGEYDCYELIFNKKDNKYSYLMARMWSEPGGIGYVTGFEVAGTNKYKLTIHIDEEDNDLVYTPAQDLTVTFDLSKVSSGILIVNNKEFKKVVGDTEEFFQSLF